MEDHKKLKTILTLAKNDISSNVYTQLKTLGAEYAFTLNKIIELREVYALERSIVIVGKDIKEMEEWATMLAEVASYFNF